MKALLVAALRRLATAWRVAGKSGYLRHGPDLHVGKGIRLWAPASIVIGRSVYIGKDVCINVPGAKDQQLFEAGIRYYK